MTMPTESNLDSLENEMEEEENPVLYLAAGVAPLIYSSPEEEGANDNARLVEVVQGTVWRDTESVQAQNEESQDDEPGALPRRSEIPRELDFSQSGYSRRGFLDED